MEEIKNDNLIQNDKSSLALKNKNDGVSIITTLMSTHLVKKPQSDDALFKSERPKNDDDVENIETKLTEIKKTNDFFSRENFISNREFNIPEKKITDELIILSKDKLDKETKQQEYEKEMKTNMEIQKQNMKKDEEKIKKYYQRRKPNTTKLNILLIILISIIFILLFILLFLLLDKYLS